MRRWRDAALVGVGAGAFALLCWRFGLSGLAEALTRVRPLYLLVYLALAVAAFLGYSLRWLVVARSLGTRAGLGDLLAARVAGDAFGSLLPAAKISGDPIRIALVSAGGVRGTLAGAGVAIDRVLELLGNTLCTATYVSIFLLTRAADSTRETGYAVIGAMLVLLVALALLLVMLRRGVRPFSLFYRGEPAPGSRLGRWMGVLRETEDHMIRFFQDHPGVFVAALGGTLLIEALIVVEYYFLLASFGLRLDLGVLLLATVATGFARGIPTPAGLGALEGAQVTVLAVTTGNAGLGFVVGMVMRLHETLWIAVGLTVLAARGFSLARLLRAAERAPA